MKKKFYLVAGLIFSFFVLNQNIFAQEKFDGSEDTFTLTKLRQCLTQNNPEIRLAQEELTRSLLDVKDAKSSFGPKIEFQASGTFLANPPIDSIVLNVDDVINSMDWQGVGPVSTGQYITLYDGMENTLYNIGFTLQQPVFTWGKISTAYGIYKEVVSIKELQLKNVTKKLLTELETRLISLCYIQQIQNVLEEETVFANRLVQYSEDAEKNGMLLKQDVLEARIKSKELDIAIKELEKQKESQLIELERMTGLQIEAEKIDYEINEELFTQVLAKDRNQILENALNGNQTSIQILLLLKNISERTQKIAENSVYWKPDFAVEMSANYAGSRFPLLEPNWRRKDDYSLNISVGMKTTVWDGGKKLNEVNRKISETKTSSINIDDARAKIKHTLDEQWNTVDVCILKSEYLDLKIQTSESKIAQKETLFQSGYASEADVLNAKIEKCNQQVEKLQLELKKAAAIMTVNFLCE